MDSPELLEMIEGEGGVVVAEDLCTTSRYFWYDVEPDPDPLEALVRFENRRPLCACLHPAEARLAFVEELADRFEAEAVIHFTLKYCHPFLYEAPLHKRALEADGLPTAVLEVGHDRSGYGQLRTRIQAFLEMVSL
jgi:benzoyl-CoA reductase subunit C